MEYREFGRTGMKVSVLGFGGSEIGWGEAPQADVDQILNEALDHGLNVIDTAECYLDSEGKIGRAVGHRRKDYFLFTKCGHKWGGGPDLEDWNINLLRQSIDHSLKRLGMEYVDLMQLHTPPAGMVADEDIFSEMIGVLESARAAGKCRFIGFSGDNEQAMTAIKTDAFDSLQTSMNIADQASLDRLLLEAKQHEMGLIIKRPLANAAWLDKPDEKRYSYQYWVRLQKLQYPFLQLSPSESIAKAMRFTMSQPGVSTMIVGSKKPGRWLENAKITEQGPLPDEEIAAIRDRWKGAAEPDWVQLS